MRRRALTVLAAALLTAGLAAPAAADTSPHWADITPWSAGSDPLPTISFPDVNGFPDADVATDTLAPASRPSGANTWLGDWTPPGEVYGTSRDRPYLSLRPAANNASSPSTTTYTFDRPTPGSGWSFTLGDIDAEFLDVSAVDADGSPVAVEDLGFRSTFNYCAERPRPTCAQNRAEPRPSWDGAGRLAGPQVDENGDPIPGWTDTNGAAAWFEPTVPLSSLTVRSTWRAGFPTYQTWFSAVSRDVTGTVAGTATCDGAGLDVMLRAADGTELATTTTGADGAYRFDDLATYADAAVAVTPPDGCRTVGEATRTADLSTTDAVVDVELEAVTTVLTGTAVDQDGEPVEEVAISVDGPDGFSATTATGADGTYTLPGLPPGEHVVSIEAPAGYEARGATERTITVDDAGADARLDVALTRIDGDSGAPGGGGPGAGEPDPPDSAVGGPPVSPGGTVGGTLPGVGGPEPWGLVLGMVFVAVGSLLLTRRSRSRAHQRSSARS